MAEVQIQSISHRHQAIADWLLANPEVKNLDVLCAEMRVSRSWLSVVMRSDTFREYFAVRRTEWEKELHGQIAAKQLGVTLKAYEKLDNIIADTTTDPRLVFDIAHKTAERLGFSPSKRTIKEEVIEELHRPVSSHVLEQARAIFRRTTTVEHEQLSAP